MSLPSPRSLVSGRRFRALGWAALAPLAVLAFAACAPFEPTTRPHVVFIVLDNVRADRLAQCGYERPTSPHLDRLCARDRARCTCGGQAPSSWTLPSHASYFTGTEVPEHGAGLGGRSGDQVDLGIGVYARPLGASLPTLAERFAERGYQTISLSGNPLVSPASGLTRGFELVESADDFGLLYGARLRRRLERILAGRDPERPLFLFLNICDAHRPWSAIPPDKHDWLPPRASLSFPQKPGQPNVTRRRYVKGEMDRDEKRALLAHLDDVYDYGVWRADETLGGTLRVLREAGIFAQDFRLVATSDHGEHLGEHGLMGHAGPYLYEEITRVPVAVFASSGVPELPEPLAALAVHDLLLDGRLRRRPVRAAAFASDTWPSWYGPEIGSLPGAALWRDDQKFTHHDGRALRFDLATDPGELKPLDASGTEAARALEFLLEALAWAAAGEAPSEEMLRLLESLGYA